MSCYDHLLDMPGCLDCERNDPHILRAQLQATEAEVARLRAALEQIGWLADATEPLSVKAGELARAALAE